MIFVFLDDQTIDVVDDIHNFVGAYEIIDVENGKYSFFDEKLRKLVPHFQKAARANSETYELVPTERDLPAFIEHLSRTIHVNPNPWFKTIDEIREFASKSLR